jgi:hypothetical protein
MVLAPYEWPAATMRSCVDPLTDFGMGKKLIQRETKVADPRDRLLFLRSALQAPHQIEDVAGPQRTVAADVLQVQAGVAVAGPIGTKVAVAAARATNAV